MADTTRTRSIAADQQAIWDVLADFGAVGSWLSLVDHSCVLQAGQNGGPIGMTRRVQIGRNTFVERIIEFDAPRALAYRVEGLPRRLGVVCTRWTLAPAGLTGSSQAGSSVVAVTSTVDIGERRVHDLAARAVVQVVASRSDAMLAELATRMERSRV